MNRLIKFFEYKHLPRNLARISAPVADLAKLMDRMLPESGEKTVGIRFLLQAKDCFVRAALELPEVGNEIEDLTSDESADK